MPQKLELNDILQELPNWRKYEGKETDAIVRDFIFPDFQEAFSYMTSVAFRAEMMNHHPEWYNCYNLVTICLNTHDVGGLSELDLEMANYLDALYKEKMGPMM